MKLYLIRHGETASNTLGRVHKRRDTEALNEVGIWQAGALAKLCAKEGVDAIYCSPEARARQTAVLVAQEVGLKPIILQELHERDWGNWAGMKWDDIQHRLSKMSMDERYTFKPPNGESWREMDERLKNALDAVTKTDGRVAIVGHGGAIRALMPILKNEPKESSFRHDFKNASVTILTNSNGKWNVELENNIVHLEV